MRMTWPVGACVMVFTAFGAMAGASAAPSKVVAFGDSLSDIGNVQARFAALNISLPASPYYDGRFSNGQVAVEVLAQGLGVSLDSRAYGGALTGTGNHLPTGGVLDGTGVQSQITQYIAGNSQQIDPSALYVIWAGGNDFFSSPTAATVTSAVTNLANDVGLLYQAGARDFFIPNLPDLASTADAIKAGGATQAGAHALSIGFNNALAQTMGQLQTALPGSHIQMFDTFGLLATVRASFASQGFNVTDGCWQGEYTGQGVLCADPSRYYLWDDVHPTTGVHQAVGRAMAAAVPEPGTVTLSIFGLALVAGAASRRRAAA